MVWEVELRKATQPEGFIGTTLDVISRPKAKVVGGLDALVGKVIHHHLARIGKMRPDRPFKR